MKPITKERNKQNKEVGLVLEGGYPSLKNVEWIQTISLRLVECFCMANVALLPVTC